MVFLAHDLKTPLTSIIAYLTMLDEQPGLSEEDKKKYIHISLEKSIRLGELISEFFEITRFNLQDIVLQKVITLIGNQIGSHGGNGEHMSTQICFNGRFLNCVIWIRKNVIRPSASVVP